MARIQPASLGLAAELPRHVGIIMDGNGRWAKARGLPRPLGHRAGMERLRGLIQLTSDLGIEALSLYAFSTENWKRPVEEVSALMKLFRQYLEEALRDFLNENIKVRFIGDTQVFPEELQKLIRETEEVSKNRTGMVLNIAMNYGGRDEIARAARILGEKVARGEIDPEEITAQAISDELYTAGQPDPDLIIRPSGEQRVSNFLLWQSAYAEYIICDILWPDFKPQDLEDALDEFSRRQRRFGGV